MTTQRATVGRDFEPAKPSIASSFGRFLIGLLLMVFMGAFLLSGFLFLRDSTLPKSIIAVFAIVWLPVSRYLRQNPFPATVSSSLSSR